MLKIGKTSTQIFGLAWWKWIAIILVLFSLTAGMLIPLAPGILEVSTTVLEPGLNSNITVIGYGAEFGDDPKNIQVWVVADTIVLACAETVQVVNKRTIKFDLELPEFAPTTNAHLFVSTMKSGVIVDPKVFYLRGFRAQGTKNLCVPNGKIVVPLAGKHFPFKKILYETIRNLYYHVTQWFGMMIILTAALVYSIIHLAKGDRRSDIIASEGVNVALFMGVLGLLTGMLWAKNTWGTYWTGDAKLNGVAMGMLVYLAYTVLRGSMDEEQKRGRVSAVYNIFAYVMFMVFIMVLPRMTDSLHPGNGGNPGFGGYDLNSNMRMVFYPAIIGWTLLGVWFINIRVRIKSIEENRLSKSHQ